MLKSTRFKTLLARAVAGEAGVPARVRGDVRRGRCRPGTRPVRAGAPEGIIFIDELDALGKARNSQHGFGGHDEKEQTLNQLLVELDGFDPWSGIVLLAAKTPSGTRPLAREVA